LDQWLANKRRGDGFEVKKTAKAKALAEPEVGKPQLGVDRYMDV
jgi:hypothetical protein